jgi:diguanylate cyclase (GGDEF)-like protein
LRNIADDGFFKRHSFIITVLAAYAGACASPLWGLGFESPSLIFWSGSILLLLAASLWRYVRPLASYPTADLAFIVSIMLSINVVSAALGPDRHWIQPMYYLLVALCALFYPIRFNFLAAGLILGLECSNALLLPNGTRLETTVNLAVFGAYLSGIAIVLGRLFKSEHRKKEKVIQAVRRMQDGAYAINPEDGEPMPVSGISPEGIEARRFQSAADFGKVLEDLVEAVHIAIPSQTALLFMPDSTGESLYLKVHRGGGNVLEDNTIPFGQGLVGWVAKEKAPVLVKEKAHGLGYLKDDEGVQSFIAVPVLNGSYLEGVIALDSPAEGVFSENDKETLNRFGRVMVYLLRGARENRKAGESAAISAALHKISEGISSSIDISTVLDKLAALSREIIPYDYLTVSFVEGKGHIRFRKLEGYDGLKVPNEPVPLEGSMLELIVDNHQQLNFSDLDKRAEKLPLFPAGLLKLDYKAFLGIPLIHQDKVIGIITLALRKSGNITASQTQMIIIIANQAATSIANAKLHQRMEMMATTDGLTGLFNHRHFQEKADEEFVRIGRYPEPLSLLLLDIDHFKKVNDTYGHPVGDAVLKRVSALLKDALRQVDVAARYGGEEFVALLKNTDTKGAQQMAERIRTTVEKAKFKLNGNDIPITLSIGFATCPEDSTDKAGLIEKADQALYWSKGHGRNRCTAYRSTLSEHRENS